MSEDSPAPWVEIDEDMKDIIVGNKEGLEALSEALKRAVLTGDQQFDEQLSETSIEKIVVMPSREEYEKTLPTYKESLTDRLLQVLILCWILVLPAVAVVFIVRALVL